jgi:hypothetical protein
MRCSHVVPLRAEPTTKTSFLPFCMVYDLFISASPEETANLNSRLRAPGV